LIISPVMRGNSSSNSSKDEARGEGGTRVCYGARQCQRCAQHHV
jgi:hypothetical protein